MKNAIDTYKNLDSKNKKSYFDGCVEKMDDEIREELHSLFAGDCDDDFFLNCYCAKHRVKFQEEFIIN